jgi:hypothetical protein
VIIPRLHPDGRAQEGEPTVRFSDSRNSEDALESTVAAAQDRMSVCVTTVAVAGMNRLAR